MVEVKLNIGSKGKTKKLVLSEYQAKGMQGKKIGEKFKGELLDMSGYEFEITGGSDSSGFPMRRDVNGISRKRVLITSGVGLRKTGRKGLRVRKTVAGNTVFDQTAQINIKVLKAGKEDLFAEPNVEEEAKTETEVSETEDKKSSEHSSNMNESSPEAKKPEATEKTAEKAPAEPEKKKEAPEEKKKEETPAEKTESKDSETKDKKSFEHSSNMNESSQVKKPSQEAKQ